MVITQVSTISQSVLSYVRIFKAESTSKCSGYCQYLKIFFPSSTSNGMLASEFIDSTKLFNVHDMNLLVQCS
jgi:hypothetical protein